MSARRQWALATRSTRYMVSLTDDGTGVVLDAWGSATDRAEPQAEPDRVLSYWPEADVAPLEYASSGQRHAAFAELLVDRGDARTGAAWSFDPTTAASRTDAGDELVLTATDETGTLSLELRYRTSRSHDVVRRGIRVTNSGDEPVRLDRALSAAWNLPLGQSARVDYLAGSWAREFQRRSIDLGWGAFEIGSRDGVTGLRFSPVVTVTGLDPSLPEGTAYGVALDWSGSWRLRVECSAVGEHVRVSCGVDDDQTTITLLPGESFSSPDALGVFSGDGADGVRDAWHLFQRTELARDLSPATRPVVYNSWYATGFDVEEEHQLALARVAADIGVETFVVDDGWFAGRTSDRAGLGDWTPDAAAFPDGLGPLADAVHGLGMGFGLWVEPEGMNPDSELFRSHPDWVYRAEGRPLLTVRNQYVLDLGRDDAVRWVEDTLRSLLSSVPIDYLKWDMNRAVTDGGRPGDVHGREWAVQHARNYHRVLETLRREFPAVVVEACASGGGRIDAAVLARSDVVWTSDEVGPRDRLVIQDGFLTAYPAHVMSSWVADDAGHRDRRPASAGYRFAVAMTGVLGIGSDILAWSPEERADAAERVAAYTGLRRVVHGGTVRTHGDPARSGYAVEFTGPDDDRRSVIFVFDEDRDRSRDRSALRVRPTGLRPGVRYRVETAWGEPVAGTVTAESARERGIRVPFSWAPDAEVLVLVPVEDAGSAG